MARSSTRCGPRPCSVRGSRSSPSIWVNGRGRERTMRIDHSVQPEHLKRAAAELESGCGCEDHDGLTGTPGDPFDAGTLDDGTIRYVLETRPHFEDLRHALGQVAGMLVLAAAGARTVTQEHPLFATARQTFARVGDGIRAARPSGRATHHHRHLLAALDALGAALGRA